MDCNMPLMDGVEATRSIRKDHPEILVIGLSMHEEGRVENAMRMAGATAYFQKGCPPDELLLAIREYAGIETLGDLRQFGMRKPLQLSKERPCGSSRRRTVFPNGRLGGTTNHISVRTAPADLEPWRNSSNDQIIIQLPLRI